MKEILFIQQNLQGGGAEKVLIDILNHFDYSVYAVTLLLVDNIGVYLDKINTNVKVVTLFNKSERFVLGYLRALHLFRVADLYTRVKINHKFKSRRYDSIISFMEGISTRCHAMMMSRAKKNVSWVHIDLILNDWCRNDYKNQEERTSFYEKVDQIAVVSEDALRSFQKLFPKANAKIVYNLIDKNQIIQKAKEYKYNTTRFTVCNVGRLSSQKRQDRIIEVASLCKNFGLDIDFVILGTGPLREQLLKDISEKGLMDSVHLLGFQPNPYAIMSASDVFLLTSDSEGYPLVICEAMCLGLPIVATDITGPREMLSDGTGVLTECDPSCIFEAVKDLYTNRNILQVYSERSCSKSEMFDVVCKMQEIYSIIE